MDSRERVLATLEFRNPDRIPRDVWTLPATRNEYGEKLDEIQAKKECDIVSLVGPLDMGLEPRYYEQGEFVDPWGCGWKNIQPGIIGEVKSPVF
ncbi:hypothetical protein [Robinsoniella sp. KNHs210]|uniref:hypothetical protein n=1 Tax=Robinsoniella sp. KNHs210 TaxID=1469950 RepID=UPI0018CC0926|nr:hypothetical protein [Robinsoniella sp. KNHs210]